MADKKALYGKTYAGKLPCSVIFAVVAVGCSFVGVSMVRSDPVMPALSARAGRNAPWSKEKAWEWHRSHKWVRGCNYMSASCANRVDQWQGYGFEERFAEAERELALAKEIGFNSMRVVLAGPGFGVWMADHDGFMGNGVDHEKIGYLISRSEGDVPLWRVEDMV